MGCAIYSAFKDVVEEVQVDDESSDPDKRIKYIPTIVAVVPSRELVSFFGLVVAFIVRDIRTNTLSATHSSIATRRTSRQLIIAWPAGSLAPTRESLQSKANWTMILHSLFTSCSLVGSTTRTQHASRKGHHTLTLPYAGVKLWATIMSEKDEL